MSRHFLLATILQTSVLFGADFRVETRQLTNGPDTHFFGYIGHVGNIPWSGDGRYIVALRSTWRDRLPGAGDPADVILINTANGDEIRKVDGCRAWNPQQGTMLYWNPEAPNTQFFFKRSRPQNGKIFCVLFDVSKDERIREFRFEDSPRRKRRRRPEGQLFLRDQLRAHGAAPGCNRLCRRIGLDGKRASSGKRRSLPNRCEDRRAKAARLVQADRRDPETDPKIRKSSGALHQPHAGEPGERSGVLFCAGRLGWPSWPQGKTNPS